MKYETQTPYIACYMLVKNDEGKIAFVMRKNTSWMNDHYGLPSGKVEKGESFVHSAVREAKEEIGIVVAPEDLSYAMTVHRASTYDDTSDLEWIDVYFVVEKWSGEVRNAEPHMHSELAWLDPENLPSNVIPSTAESVGAWLKGEKYYEQGW